MNHRMSDRRVAGAAATVLVALTIAAGAAWAQDCEIPLFVKQGLTGANVMILADNSGSMNAGAPNAVPSQAEYFGQKTGTSIEIGSGSAGHSAARGSQKSSHTATASSRVDGAGNQAWLRPAMEDALVVENGSNAPDSVTVRYEGDVDCTGAATVGPDFVVTNSFTVVNGNLVCNGEVIAIGVEDFQILLGEDTNGDGGTNRLVAPGTASLDVSQISSIRVYLLLVTPEERVQRFAQVFSYFQNTDELGQATAYDDGRRRLELAAVLATRNPVGT